MVLSNVNEFTVPADGTFLAPFIFFRHRWQDGILFAHRTTHVCGQISCLATFKTNVRARLGEAVPRASATNPPSLVDSVTHLRDLELGVVRGDAGLGALPWAGQLGAAQ